MCILQRLREGHRGEVGTHTLYRGLELCVKRFVDLRGDLRPDPERLDRLVDDHGAAGLGHRCEEGFAVQRRDGAQVDHFRRDTVGGELLGHRVAVQDTPAVADQGDIAAFADDVGLAQWNLHPALRSRPRVPVGGHVLDE
ncbi:hypothetical protein D9M68_906930 [compost metagenome]